MADVVNFTTWPNQNSFYLLQTNFVNFEVKAPRNAFVKLGRKPNRSDILIGIGDGGNSCWIMKDKNNISSTCVGNVITSMQYRRFWVTWAGGLIKLGCDGETTPIVTLTNKYPDLSYVAFGVLREINPVEWKLELPPVITTPECKLISGGKLKWVRAEDQLPVGALIGGFENETLYIIRAAHMHSLTPGKFVPSQGTAYLPWGGDEHPKSEFEVLCGYDCTWKQSCEDRVPMGAFAGGFSEVQHETLFIGRAEHNGHLIPGKVQPSHKVCYISFDGREIGKQNYEILIDPNITVLCGYNCTWVQTCGDRIPVGAFAGGFSEVRHETLYIGRAEHNGHLIPGKVASSHKVCYISFAGKEIAKNSYEILIDSYVTMGLNDLNFSSDSIIGQLSYSINCLYSAR